jgi:succinate-semialdehyde dehydrogenase / glutarate-semialdehyde dehydrogenase
MDQRPDAKQLLESVPKQLYIGGKWVDGSKGTLPVENPATGEILCEVADADAADAMSALDAAAEKQKEWAAVAPRERGEILRRSWELLNARADELALLLTLEMGKSLAEAKAEIAYGSEFFRWFSEEAVRIQGNYSTSANGDGRTLVLRQPVGPCVLITPWNFPLAMGTRKIGPAVAAGCTMVIKPAGATPLSMLMLAAVMEEAGLPPGVLNVITSSSSGSVIKPLLEDPRTRKVSFTGSTEVGRILMQQASQNVLRSSMELGGNAPFIVFEDADLDAAVEGARIAKLRNIGESCVAANRFYVHESIADEFAQRLADQFKGLKVGPGTDPETDLGPLISEDQRDTVSGLVDDAVSKGAACVYGGKKLDGPGYFYEPTVLKDVPLEAKLAKEEIFGPVAPIFVFATEEDAIREANNTEYGLVAYVYTNDLTRGLRVIEALDTGMVGLNRGMVSNPAAPFGGVKHSGIGREGGREGIEEYLEVKHVAISL